MKPFVYTLAILTAIEAAKANAQQPCPNGNCQPQAQGEYHPATRVLKRGYHRVGRIWYGIFSPINLPIGK